MFRLALTLLLMTLVISPASGQDADAEAEGDTGAPQESAPADEEVTDDDIEELLGLGDEEYTELEDDFDPTEEVRFEQSIPFPTDI